jgi:hypothetical protein
LGSSRQLLKAAHKLTQNIGKQLYVQQNLLENAPEIFGDPDSGFYDEKSDIFSFAMVLYQLFGSSTLYQDNTNDSEGEDYADFMENGRLLPPRQIIEAIRNVCHYFLLLFIFHSSHQVLLLRVTG